MTFLVLFARKMMLKNQFSDLNYRLMQKEQELQDLQSYTAAIADGEVSLNDLSTAPASMFGNLTQYMVGSNNYAMNAAQTQYGAMGGQMTQVSSDAMAQQQYQQLVFKNLYDTQKQQYLKAEQAKLHVKEKSIENEKLKLEQQLKLIETELSSLDKSIDNGIKDAVPQYA
ncbi:hypothetical protein IJ707_08010 [bacterium]|nr:hypothetical protein [bacterium]